MIRLRKKIREMETSSTLEITARAEELRAAGHKVIPFAAGQPDWRTPEHVCLAAGEAIAAGLTGYTASAGLPELRDAVARHYSKRLGVPLARANVVITVGAKHALHLFMQATLNPGDEVILPSPYWVSYPTMIESASARPVIVPCGPETGCRLTVKAFEKAVTRKTRLLLLNSPSNPTGTVYPRDEMQALAGAALERGVTVLSDEIYEHLVFGKAEHVSPLSLFPDRFGDIAVVSGPSKTFSMTGWRVGWLIAVPEVAAAVAKVVGHTTSSTATFSQKACVAALDGDMSFLAGWISQYVARRDAMLEVLRGIDGVTPFVPDGAFYLWVGVAGLLGKRFPEGGPVGTSRALAKWLLETGHVASVPGSAFGAEGYLRLSFATSMENCREGAARIAGAAARLLPGG